MPQSKWLASVTSGRISNPAPTPKTELMYFVQRGQWAGYWRRVPLQTRVRVLDLRSRLTGRGYFVREVVA